MTVKEEIRVEDLQEEKFTEEFQKIRHLILIDPIKYFVEAKGFINFKPTPAQRVALKIIFGQELNSETPYGVNFETQLENNLFQLETRMMTEVELYEYMTGKPYVKNVPGLISDVDLIIGRRGGKSSISAILALFAAIKENWKPYLSKTPHATVLILSHGKEFSQEILEIIRELVNQSPILSRLMNKKKKNTQSTFNLQVPFFGMLEGKRIIEYSRVKIKVGAASKRTTRGEAVCFSLNDEIAFWRSDEKHAEKDDDIIRAIRPSMGQFKGKAMMIKLSSPGIKQGILYNEYQNRFELPPSFAVFKAPSWVWNNMLEDKFLNTEYALDPAGFASEYRSDFVDSLSDFISAEQVDMCVLKKTDSLPPEPRKTDVVYTAAIDAAFKGDRFAFTIMGWMGARLKQYVVKTWQGNRREPVKAKEVAQYISNICRDYGVSRVHADQYAFQPLKEIFEQYGLTLIETPFTPNFKKQIFFNLKSMIHNLKIDLLDHPITISEIKQLQVEQSSTGMVRIGHPPGGHDDCADVTAIASYLLTYNVYKGGGLDQSEIAGEDYGISLDQYGRTITQAPSSEMMGSLYGYEIFDNSAMYVRDPKTGEYKRIEEVESEEEEMAGEAGGDFIFS